MFRQLVVVRAHATHALTDAGETEPTLGRRDAWVSALATVESRTDRLDLRRRYRVVDDDYAAVRAMLHRNLVEHPFRAGARMAGWLHGYWYYRGQLVEAVRWLELAVEALDEGAEAIDEAWVHLGLAKMLAHQGRVDRGPQAQRARARRRRPDRARAPERVRPRRRHPGRQPVVGR